ncbi:MAG: hypothetical protein AAB770_01325 [Patescibacteria group bacterium]|mgnify:CR=1 FL=1
MSFVFIFNNINNIFLAVWSVLIILVALRFFYPAWVKNVSYTWFVVAAISIHFFYGALVTWGQYYVWANGNTFTQSLLSAHLPVEAPLPSAIEWTRPYFEQPLGYFSYYVFGRLWLNIIILFLISGFFYSVLKLWSFYKGGFLPNGPEIILALLLISGYPGILVLVPLGFIMSIIWFTILYFKNRTTVVPPMYIEPVFLIATPAVLFFSKTILSYL